MILRLTRVAASLLLHARDGLQPRFVVRGPHVHAGQIRRGALDAVRHGADQRPTAVVLLDHQWTAAVTLRTTTTKHIKRDRCREDKKKTHDDRRIT